MFKPLSIIAVPSGVVLWLAASCLSAPAQQFSADLVRRDAGATDSHAAGKINVSGGRVRIETSDVRAGYFLILGDAEAAYFIRPAAKIFMDARQSSVLTQLLVAVDPDDPCTQLRQAARVAGTAGQGAEWHCERVGSDDAADSRRTIIYRAISVQGQRYFVWIDLLLRFPVKLQMEDGAVVDVANIHDAPQPESLFVVPAGYRKFDPQQLVDRVRQSDVWVEPPR
jgi:hypothetical protein